MYLGRETEELAEVWFVLDNDCIVGRPSTYYGLQEVQTKTVRLEVKYKRRQQEDIVFCP
jgi:hypothetical protein